MLLNTVITYFPELSGRLPAEFRAEVPADATPVYNPPYNQRMHTDGGGKCVRVGQSNAAVV